MFKVLQKRIMCMLLALLMVFSAVPVNSFVTTVHAAQEDGLCAHHTAHDELCGYAEATGQPCGNICESCNAEAALENVIALFTALPAASSITAETADEEKDAVFAQLEAAMAAYDALLEEYPEQAAVFEETQLALIQEAFALNDALTGNIAQTYALQSYNPYSRNNVTITIRDTAGNAITGALVAVSSGNDTFEVYDARNGQYKFTGKRNTNTYDITVSADGYETLETQIQGSSINITLNSAGNQDQTNLKTFKVYYIATGQLPNSYAGAGDSSDYGPSGNNNPLVLITVDINKLKQDYSSVVQYKENTNSNYWEFTPKGQSKDMAAVEAFWQAVWACMTEESRAAFEDTGFADDFFGYVLKQQKSDRSQHCDGVLTKTPPVYVTELYENNVYFGGTVTDGDDAFKKMTDIQDMFEARLGVDIIWSSNTTGIYYSGNKIYTATITQTNAANAVHVFGGIAYESKNNTNTYYLAKFNLTTAEGAAGYYAVIYTDGVDSETIFDNQLTTVKSGNKAPAFNGTPQREGYTFKGWRQEGSNSVLTDVQITELTVTSNLTFHAVWEPIPTSFTGTVNVALNDTYATDITALMDANTKLYVSQTAGSYVQLERTGLGVYSAELENGTWHLYYSNDGVTYTMVDSGALVINNAPASRDLDFYSVSYALDGGTVSPQLPVSYYIQGSQVDVTAAVPTKAGYLFTAWKSGDTLYQPNANLTGSIDRAYSLVAQWEKTVNVTVNVTIIHENENGYIDPETTRDDVYLELVSKANATAAYLETGNDLTLNDTDHDGFAYTIGDIDGMLTTKYTATGVTFADMPGGTAEYSVVTSKTSYDTEVTASKDANGNWIINVRMAFNPTNFDLQFSVDVARSVPEAYLPKAAIVKVTFWNGTEWKVITQHADGAPGVRVNIDPTTYSGTGSYPVWKTVSGNTTPYGYRVVVTSFVYPDGTIVPASMVKANKQWGDSVYLATLQDFTDGQAFGDLNGAYYDATAQKGTLNVLINMDLYNVTFNAMGGTVNGQATQIVENQYMIPALSNYKPVRDGGYIFEGWYTKDGSNGDWGEEAISHTDLTKSITLYAKWNAPIEVTGTVYVAGSYQLDGQTHPINDADRAKTAMIVLRKQGSNGVFGTAEVAITYGNGDLGTGTYAFTGLADDGTVYYVEERAANYGGKYINEPESLTVTTNFAAYSDSDNVAVLDGDKTAQVNVYLPFDPASFDLKYSVDATAIGSAFRPETVEMLVTYDADHTITEPANWPVISQMDFGNEYRGNVLTLSDGKASGSTSVWNYFPNGITRYDYGICVDAVTGSALSAYATAPYSITYQAPAHQTSGGQSKALIATLTPNQYNIRYELGFESFVVDGMNGAPNAHTWSYDTDLSGVTPRLNGYEFLGWYDNADFTGNPVTKIDAAVAEDVTLYAKWYQMMDDVDLTVTVIHKTPDGNGEAGNYDKDMDVQLTRAAEGASNYEAVTGQQKTYKKDDWHTLGDDADEETLFVPQIFEGLASDYAYNLNVSLDGYYVTEKTVNPVVDTLTGATTYQIAITLQYNPDLLNFRFGVEMAPGIDPSLWPESAEVRVTSWYNHPSEEIGLDWNTITQHESSSVKVTLDSTGSGTGVYPVWQWLDKEQNKPYYYRIEVISLQLSDGSVVMVNGNNTEHDVVYYGGDYTATIVTDKCVVPSNPSDTVSTSLAGAYGQSASGSYAQCGEVKAVITIDRWKDDGNKDSETGGDGTKDHQQALMLFRSEDTAKGVVDGEVCQVFTLDQQDDGSYCKPITPSNAVTTNANTQSGYVFSKWTDEAGKTVDPFQEQILQGGQTYVYTANWEYNPNLSYTVKYLEKGTNNELVTEKTTPNITYGTKIAAEDKKISIPGYVFDSASASEITIGMDENVLTLYYAADSLDDANDSETGGDGIADYKQVVIQFTSGPNGSVDGKTTQVITLTNVDANGNYVGSITPESVIIAANTHYQFDKWTLPSGQEKTEENAPYVETNKLAVTGGQTYRYTVFWKARTYTYQVQYLEKGSNIVLSDAVTKNLFYDGTAQTETAISIIGYSLPTNDSGVRTLAYTDGQVITFYYEKNTYPLTVHFVDIDTDESVHDDAVVLDLPYLDKPSIPVLQNLATIPGYHYVKADPDPVVIMDESQLSSGKNEITLKYEKNLYDLKVLYYYDGVLNAAKTEILQGKPYGTAISNLWKHTGDYDQSGTEYMLDKITGNNATISDNTALNVVHVYYISDRLVDNVDTQVTPDSDGVGDGIPDIYQATVTYEVINGTWENQTETKLSYVFTLFEQNPDGSWSPIVAKLDSTVPTGNAASGFSGTGNWTPAVPDKDTAVLGNIDYVLAYTDAYTHAITVTVVNGSVEVDGTEETETHFTRMVADPRHPSSDKDSTELVFTPAEDHMLWSVTVDGVDLSNPTLTNGEYVYNVAHDDDHNITVVFEKDAFGEDNDGDGDCEEPDGIPDKYQKRINFQIINGTWNKPDNTTNADSADKHIYVTLTAADDTYDINGTAEISADPYPNKQPVAGYLENSGAWKDALADAVSFPKVVSGLQEETFIYSYTTKKTVTIKIEVVGGTSIPRPSTTVYEYSETETTIEFDGNEDHILTSSIVNNVDVSLVNEKYTHDYTDDLEIRVVYKLDRWKDSQKTQEDDVDSETGGDKIADDEQALVNFLAGENGELEGTTTQVYSFTGSSGSVTLENVTVKAQPGYRLLYWRDTAGRTYTSSQLFENVQTLEGGKQYTYTAIFGKALYTYTVEYYFDGVLDSSKTTTSSEVEYLTSVTLNPATRAGADSQYVLDKVTPAPLLVSYVPENNVIRVYYATDLLNDENDTKTDGDGIPDYKQAVIRFDSDDYGSVSGETTQVFTLKENGSSYSDIVVPAVVTTTAVTGYKFSHWTMAAAEVNPYQPTVLSGGQEIVYIANFCKDVFDYTVEYYFDGVQDPSKTETISGAEFNSDVSFTPAIPVDDRYMVEKIDPKPLTISHISANNVIKVYYVTDLLDDENDKTEGGDGIPDYRQVLVTFVPGDTNGTVTGTGTTQVFTFPAGATSGDVTPDLNNVVATGKQGYAFDYWTRGNLLQQVNPATTLAHVPGNTTIVFKAHFAKDAWKDSANTPADDTDSETGGDNIPDKYQAVVTYTVENGTWSDDTNSNLTEIFTLYRWNPENFRWTKLDVTLGDTVPKGMKPSVGYTTSGYWEESDTVADDPVSTTPVTQNATYSYCYGERVKFNITVTVENGQVTPDKTSIQVVYGEDQTLSFQPDTDYTLDSVTVDDAAAILTDGAYTFTNVVADHSIHVVYSKDNWKDAEKTPEEDTDSEEGGDGIPDYRQAVVAFAADANGTIVGTSRYVITLSESNGAYNGQFCAKKDEVSAKANEGYKFAKWTLTKEALVRATPADAVDPYVPMDIAGGNYYLFRAQFTEDMCNVTYPEKDADESTTVPVQSAKYIQIKPNGGIWQNSTEDQKVQITGDYTVDDPVRSGYLFMGWVRTEGTEEDVVYVFTAQWEKDAVGKTDADGKDIPDGIPDKYQKKVVFKVVNGYWKQGTDADVVLWMTLADENGNWDVNGSAKLDALTGMYAKTGYENGKWDTTPPATVKGTTAETFTYQFSMIPVNDQVPDTADTTAEILWFSLAGMLMSAAALMLLYHSSEKRKAR